MYRTTREKIKMETSDLNSTISQQDLTDICRTPYPTTAEYTFYRNTHGTFSRGEHMLGQTTNLNKLKRQK